MISQTRSQLPASATAAAYAWLHVIALLLLALDQISKQLIVRSYQVGDSHRVLGPLMSFTRRTNTGGAFGVLSDSTLIITIVSTVVVLTLIIVGPRLAAGSRTGLLGIGLALGGALGNLMDRVRLGHVVDFVDFHFWPVFNVADAGITIGAIMIAIAILRAPAGHDVPALAPEPEDE